MPKKTIAQILDGAADVIETRGMCKESMYDKHVDKFCALGAIARGTYPKRVSDRLIESLAWVRPGAGPGTLNPEIRDMIDPRYFEAVAYAAAEARRRSGLSAREFDDHSAVYTYNDTDSIKKNHVASMLRAAAKRARADAEKAKAKS